MPPPKGITKEELEIRLTPITTALNDVTVEVFGDAPRLVTGLKARMVVVEAWADKYKFTLALLALLFNSVISIALASLEIWKVVHGIP